MGLTVEDFKKLQNPYTELGSGDQLAKHREELDKLTPEDKIEFASLLVLDCPEENLNEFGLQIEALRNPKDDVTTFHEALSKAFEVRKRIVSLNNHKNPHPHRLMLGTEFNEELFNQFNKLVIDVLKDKETEIATRLALTTPEQDRKELIRNIKTTFPGSTFLTKMEAALNLRHCIEDQLLSDNPAQFFSSRDFNIDYCLEFSALFRLLEDRELDTATKLVLTTPQSDRKKLTQFRNAFPGSLLSEKIGAALNLHHCIESQLLGNNPELFFSSRDFNLDNCLELSELFRLTSGQESEIATKLALAIPQNERKQLNPFRKAFSKSVLSEKIGAAFNLLHCIETQLLSDVPELFFSSQDFNVEYCLEFSGLFSIIKGKEKEIGEKLALVESPKTRSEIGVLLEQLNPAAHDQNNSFRLIASAMASSSKHQEPARPQERNQHAAPKANGPHFFNPQPSRRIPQIEPSDDLTEETSSEEEEQDHSSCCGLFK